MPVNEDALVRSEVKLKVVVLKVIVDTVLIYA